MRVITKGETVSGESVINKGLLLDENEVAILKDIMDSLDEDSFIDQEVLLIREICKVDV